jgi:nicotinic acetylcholine receptor
VSNEDAKRLLDDLFSNYNPVVRPVSDPADTIRLSIGLKLSQIADIVIKLGIHTCFVFFKEMLN